jgi:RNA polymerase sigma-70 factor, ECF subfamily
MVVASAHHAAPPGGWILTVARVIGAQGATADPIGLAMVEAAQAGDVDAFEHLIRPRLTRLLRLAFSILGNEADAQDVVQDACLRAWRELPRLRERDRFEAWLWQIVVNACRSRLRVRKVTRIREIAVDELLPGEEPIHGHRPLADDLGAIDEIRRAFARLDADKRTILVLHHAEGRSVVDIATLLGVPEGTVKWRLHAARRALERALAEEAR